EDRSRATEASQTVDINSPPGIERLFDGHLNLAHPIGRGRVHIRDGQTPVSDSPIPRHRLFLEELRVRLKPFAFVSQIEKEVYAWLQKLRQLSAGLVFCPRPGILARQQSSGN